MTTFLREAFRVKRRSYPERIRAALFLAIKRTAANLDACVKVPGKDFSRTRKLPLQAMLLMLIGMGSGSLSKELYDWFGYTSSTATASAFVQQRNKIRPEAVKMIFNEFVSSTTPTATFQGYRLFAVDGSDLRLPSDPTNDFSLIRNAEGQKQYNLAHLNAMFDLMSKVYVDATMQGKKGMNEHSALVSMIDRSNIPGKVIVLMDRGYESLKYCPCTCRQSDQDDNINAIKTLFPLWLFNIAFLKTIYIMQSQMPSGHLLLSCVKMAATAKISSFAYLR